MNKIILGILALLASSALVTQYGCSGSTGSGTGAPTGSQAVTITPIGGMAPLTINVGISASYVNDFQGNISSISWDFGDGSSASSTNATHTYTIPGSYPLTVTATSTQGDNYTYSDVIHVAPQINNSAASIGISHTFFDNFEYVVDRDGDPDAGYSAITNQGHWEHAKAENMPNASGKGYIYTTTDIPGYEGTFPGINSSRVLVMEARPVTLGFETDFYLQFGQGSIDNTVPANVWFQFWMYPVYFEDQKSEFENRFKFIYPCNGGYGCQADNIKWLNTIGHTTGNPFWANRDTRDTTELYITTLDPFPDDTTSDFQWAGSVPYDAHKIGQTNVNENIAHNRWTLVTLHYDTSSSAAGGTFQAWLKPLGGTEVQVANWVNGTPVEGQAFTWTIPSGQEGGHRMFRMPTTVNDHDFWIYMDDFAIATSRSDLPVYPY